MLISLTTVWYMVVLCKFLGYFWAFWERDIFSQRLNWGKYEMLKIWWIWKIEIWSEELVDGYQTVPYQPGTLFGGGLLFQTSFNPNNSLLIILQISLLFRFTPALTIILYFDLVSFATARTRSYDHLVTRSVTTTFFFCPEKKPKTHA